METGTTLELFIFGEPQGHPRPRVVRRGKIVSTYTPVTDWMKGMMEGFEKECPDPRPICGPVAVEMIFWMPRPKTHLKKDGGLRKGKPIYHVGKPDVDNLAKGVLDAMVRHGFLGDDSLVVYLSCSKRYCDELVHLEEGEPSDVGCWVKVEEIENG